MTSTLFFVVFCLSVVGLLYDRISRVSIAMSAKDSALNAVGYRFWVAHFTWMLSEAGFAFGLSGWLLGLAITNMYVVTVVALLSASAWLLFKIRKRND